MVHPSSIEAFEHHEGIRDGNSFVPLVTVQTLETGEPAPHEIKQLPVPVQPQPHHFHHGSAPVVSSLPQRLSPSPAPHHHGGTSLKSMAVTPLPHQLCPLLLNLWRRQHNL